MCNIYKMIKLVDQDGLTFKAFMSGLVIIKAVR